VKRFVIHKIVVPFSACFASWSRSFGGLPIVKVLGGINTTFVS
jgi:hypothetical protein